MGGTEGEGQLPSGAAGEEAQPENILTNEHKSEFH